jgi:mannosyltransferase OCH1-like enzyme
MSRLGWFLVGFLVVCIVLCVTCAVWGYVRRHSTGRTLLLRSYPSRVVSTSYDPIPRVIFQTLRTYDVNDLFFTSVIAPKLRMHPDFTFQFYDNARIDRFLLRHFPSYVYDTYKTINPKFGACLSDFARYCLLYIYGGVYMDIKSHVTQNLRPLLQQYARDSPTLVVSHWRWLAPNRHILPFARGELQNWAFLATPRHPVLRIVIDSMVRRLHSPFNGTTKQFVLELTGPVLFSHAIYDAMLDEHLKNTVVITDALNEYVEYTTLTMECLGDCKPLLYDRQAHYSDVGENVIQTP